MKNTFLNNCKSISLILLLGFCLAIPESEARNLSKRLGAGFISQVASIDGGTLPALSAKYYFSKRIAAALGLGFDTRSDRSATAIGTKFFYNLFGEQNLLFYIGGGLALVSQSGTHLQIQSFFGSEFFLTDLPSLGFSFEAGIRGDNTHGGKFAIRTTGDSFLTAGIHFYF